MFAEKDWNQIKDYVIEILPQLLQKQPEIVNAIENLIARQFPRRDEFTRLLDEMKSFREQMHQHFIQVNQRMEWVEKRIEQTERRIEQVEHRLEQTEHRLNLWREEVNQRLDKQHQNTLDLLPQNIYKHKNADDVNRQCERVYSHFP